MALAELRIEAGCSAWGAGLYGRTMYHFARSLELATDTDDTYLQVLALRHAGLASVEHGHPDDGLKMLQCAQARTWEIPRHDQRAVIVGVSGRAAAEAVCLQESATALARLGDLGAAFTALAKGRDLWTPTRSDLFGDMDRGAARLELERGRLDVAEARAVASVHRWEGGRQLGRTASGAVLATVYVTAGDSRGLPLAHRAITDAGKLGSVRVRRLCVGPLADALDNRPGADARDLARQARQIATARA
ncbi:MAG: hypothetical protein ACRDTE_29070 [Pseudonocardiaceae bacterium]